MIQESGGHKQIVISDNKHDLPYSKGLMASSLMATGLPPGRSYTIARLIEDYLKTNNRYSVSLKELREVAYELLLSHEGKEYAEMYNRWQALLNLDRPIIILIGGTTGVGKSTIATAVAHRLGITHVVATDSIREVMRAVLSKDLMPTLHESTFMAWKAINQPLEKDPLIAGFREQTKVVAVGIRSVIDRAVRERLNIVIEGVHIVPGFINSTMCEKAFIIPMIITVDDDHLHRSHFYVRELQTEGARPLERYRENFESIRKIGEYIETLADRYCVPILTSHNIDTTISAVMDEVLNEVLGPPQDLGLRDAAMIDGCDGVHQL